MNICYEQPGGRVTGAAFPLSEELRFHLFHVMQLVKHRMVYSDILAGSSLCGTPSWWYSKAKY